VKIFVSLTGPLPRVGLYGPYSTEIGIEVPDKSDSSFESARTTATAQFLYGLNAAREVKCEPPGFQKAREFASSFKWRPKAYTDDDVRIIGAF